MQITNVFTFIAIAIAGVSALPGYPGGGGPPGGQHPPPPPQPPVINHQVVRIYLLLFLITFETPSLDADTHQNYCSSGAPYCCSPNSEYGSSLQGTTCALSTTQCNSVSICCNNAANGGGSAVSTLFPAAPSSFLRKNNTYPYLPLTMNNFIHQQDPGL